MISLDSSRVTPGMVVRLFQGDWFVISNVHRVDEYRELTLMIIRPNVYWAGSAVWIVRPALAEKFNVLEGFKAER